MYKYMVAIYFAKGTMTGFSRDEIVTSAPITNSVTLHKIEKKLCKVRDWDNVVILNFNLLSAYPTEEVM